MTFFDRFFSAPPRADADGRHVRDNLTSLISMAWYVEARDPYTGGHLWRVAEYARKLASAAGWAPEDVARVRLGGFLHDIGKIGVPDAVLRKPDKLTDAEFEIIRTHPDLGLRMIAPHPLAGFVADAIAHHHERPDGRGYPLGLAGEAIPADARVLAIADTFDAMTSTRPYRKGMETGKALAILEAGAGTQFDAGLAKVFVALGRAGELDHALGHADEGIPMRACPMCGPILALTARARAGDCLVCRNCTAEFELVAEQGSLQPKPTGRQGTARQLEPAADEDLIARIVAETLAATPAETWARGAPRLAANPANRTRAA